MNSKLRALGILGQSRSPLVWKAPRCVKNLQHFDRDPTHSVGHQVPGVGDDPFACAGYSPRSTEPKLVRQHRHRWQHSGSTTLTPALSRWAGEGAMQVASPAISTGGSTTLTPALSREREKERERESRHHLPRDGRWLFNLLLPTGKAASTPLSLRERARVRVEFPTTPKQAPQAGFSWGVTDNPPDR